MVTKIKVLCDPIAFFECLQGVIGKFTHYTYVPRTNGNTKLLGDECCGEVKKNKGQFVSVDENHGNTTADIQCYSLLHVVLTCSITSLCIKTITGDQKLGSGRLSTSPDMIFNVCHRNESLRPCRKIASKVVVKELVLSHNSKQSAEQSEQQ